MSNSNLPEGCFPETLEAPWADSSDYSFNLLVTCSGQIDGACSPEEYDNMVEDIKESVKEQILRIGEVSSVTEVF